MSGNWHVLGTRGCGSVIVEAALLLAGISFTREEVDYDAPGPARDRLRALNPLGQVPTVILSNGEVMTESLAMIQLIDDLAPSAGLVPRASDPSRAAYLRWSQFVVAAIYPTFTYGDQPEKWIGEHGPLLRSATDEHRKTLYRQMEKVGGAPYFLGEKRTAMDLYLAAMTHWRPGRAWFEAECPKLLACAVDVTKAPELQALFATNFDA